jgi:class 3 adenylate cyclase/tetratricopeptide (TPR) repeat protein
VTRCPNCNHENPQGSQFCNACGSTLATVPLPRREERKFATVLFADLVDFTSRAERMDPEDVRALLDSYHRRVRYELERKGGTVEKFIGDAVMAVFGAPLAREDDPERAVRAALAIRDWVGEEASDLQVRVGVNTGEVLVALNARPGEGEAMVAGDVVNSASRLQAASPVNGILVGESTYRATRGAIEYLEAAPITAKGKTEPILVWQAIAPLARVGVERLGGADLVGRNHELTLVQDSLTRVRGDREPQLVTLVGVPGIGKSRLVFELFKSIEVHPDLVYWRRGRSLPYGEGVAFWAVAEMVKAQAGILEGDPAEDAEGKLRAAVYGLIDEEGDAQRVQAQLRPLIGVAGDGEARGAGRGEAFAAWRRFFEAMAERRPLVMVFEDLHWADDALLDFVDELVDWAGGVPLLVLVTARPELLARRPGWGGGKPNAVTISLSPLSDEETARLVRSLLGRSLLPVETQTALLERAGGNPLYAEEFVALVQERGLGAESTSALPESVQGILSARLDALSGEDKTLLQSAAVLGRVFWTGALAHVADRDRSEVEGRLHTLERREFVRRERRTSVAGETEYLFRHLLVRDVAYAQLPRRLRAERHRLAAEWIESLGRPEDHAEVLVHHYLAALEYARASGQDFGTVADRARAALRRAGERALSLNAFDSAARFFASALELTQADDESRPYLLLGSAEAQYSGGGSPVSILEEAIGDLIGAGDLERAARGDLMLGDLAWRQGRRDQAYEHLDRAVELLKERPASPSKAWVLSEVSRYHMLGGRYREAIDVGGEALGMAEEFGMAEVKAHALNNIGTARASVDDLGGIDDLKRSIEIAAAAHSVEELRGRNNLASGFLGLGDFHQALEAWIPGIELAEQYRGVPNAEWILSQRLTIAFATGNWNDFLRLMDDYLLQGGLTEYQAAHFHGMRSRIRLARGDLPKATEDAEFALAIDRGAKDPQRLLPGLGVSALVLLHAGRTEECTERVNELMRLDPLRAGISHPINPVLDLAWILTALGRAEEFLIAAAGVETLTRWHEAGVLFARGQVERAVDICAKIGVLPNEAYTRLRGAERLLEEGRPEEAEAQLERALLFYSTVGASAYIREAENLRASYGSEAASGQER